MKTPYLSTTILLTLLSATFFVHAEGMNGMSIKDVPTSGQIAGQKDEKVHHGTGTVQKFDAANSRVTIAHGPISSLRWPPMTMSFAVQDRKLLEHLVTGEKIDFDLVQSVKDQYVITRITPSR
ncbi:MAG: copper-binding protein [Burkholderiales bacterium]